MKSSELFLRSVYKLGIQNVFGIVGGEAQSMQFDEEKNIRFYLTRHEFTAGIMADTFSRVTGNPQMCYSTFGPGLTNMATGVFSAIQDRSPILVVSAQVPTEEICFNQTHQCADNISLMRTITKYAVEIRNVYEIPSLLSKALTISINGTPGPVYISFPRDLMGKEIDDTLAYNLLDRLKPIKKKEGLGIDINKLDQIVEKIDSARHPLIIAGNQIIRENCCEELEKLAESKNIPVMATLSSKGVIPSNHPLFLTTANKYIERIFHEDIIKKIFGKCDLMLLIGYDFGEDAKPSLWNDAIESIVINSHYHDMGRVFQPSMVYLGNLSKSLEYLRKNSVTIKSIPNNIVEAKNIINQDIFSDQGQTKNLKNIICSIRGSLGKDGILAVDVGLHKLYAALFDETEKPNTFISSNVCGTFGFGLPAALGVKLAKPETRVCVVCGDGGFHSVSQDLETAARYNIAVVIVVLNDNSFGMIKACQYFSRDEIFSPSVDLGKVDFVKLAQANGVEAEYLDDINLLKDTMDRAFQKNKPYLIEIPITYCYKM